MYFSFCFFSFKDGSICNSDLLCMHEFPTNECTLRNSSFYMSRIIILIMKNVIRMMPPIDGCKDADLDVEVLKPGGVSDPKPVVVPEPGLLEFNTDGGVTVLQKAHIEPCH